VSGSDWRDLMPTTAAAAAAAVTAVAAATITTADRGVSTWHDSGSGQRDSLSPD